MVNNIFRKFSGKSAILSLSDRQILCISDFSKVLRPASYIVRESLVYNYSSGFVSGGNYYAVYELTDLSFSQLVKLVSKYNCSSVVEFVYE